MKTSDFYDIIDNELQELLERYKNDDYLKKHEKNINSQKSYALLIWFLDFYGKTSNYVDFITEGKGDNSCDIVFENVDNQGNKIFYIVQSKWNSKPKANQDTDKDEILKALSNFDTILRVEPKEVNDKLRTKLRELDRHLKANGEVKFIFLSLSQYKGEAEANIAAFKKNDSKRKVEVIDINRIKSDYIDRNYKKINPINPLETQYNPEEDSIKIRLAHNANFIKVEKPFDAYTVLVRPKMIYELFEKYNFLLFKKNVRNPLLQSQFNEEIENTVSNNPAFFWYYNNGITAITTLLPTIGQQAETIEIMGLEVINGAQTVYSIYRAYKNASPGKRLQMNEDALITLRLLRTGGDDFDINVTRYTNSQNPVNDRDFCANDDIQIALQNASYKTPVWYQKRRGEFRELPEGVRGVSNEVFADVYMAFYLQDPVTLFRKYGYEIAQNKNLSFISGNNGNIEGLYERIFNENTSFEDMLSAFYVADTVLEQTEKTIHDVSFPFFYWLALSKLTITKYLQEKLDENINVSRHIIRCYEKEEKDFILKAFGWTMGLQAYSNIEQHLDQMFKNHSFFENMKKEFEKVIEVNHVENMPIDRAIDVIKALGFRVNINIK